MKAAPDGNRLTSPVPTFQKYSRWLSWLALLVCLFLIWNYFQGHRDELQTIKNISPSSFLTIALMIAIGHLAQAQKLFLILQHLRVQDISFREWFKIFSVSRFLNCHILQGGNIYRSYALKKHYRFPYAESLGFIMVFSWFDIFFAVLFAIGVLAVVSPQGRLWGIPTIAIFVFLLALLILSVFVFRASFSLTCQAVKRWSWLFERLNLFSSAFLRSIHDQGLLIRVSLLSFLYFASLVAAVYVSHQAIGIPGTIAGAVVLTMLLLLGMLLSITPNNIGVLEIAFGYTSQALGTSWGEGMLVCGVYRLIGYAVIVLVNLAVIIPSFLKAKKFL